MGDIISFSLNYAIKGAIGKDVISCTKNWLANYRKIFLVSLKVS